jgi:hypothetical protein
MYQILFLQACHQVHQASSVSAELFTGPANPVAHRPGVYLMKSHFGLKVFGNKFLSYLQLWTNLNPKMQFYEGKILGFNDKTSNENMYFRFYM